MRKVAWAMSYVQLVVSAYRSVSRFRMFAIQGGEECEQEVRFIEEVMHALGFTTTAFRSSGTDVAENPYTIWVWKLERPDAGDFVVELAQYPQVDEVSVAQLGFALRAEETERHSPNLRRCAIVSCP